MIDLTQIQQPLTAGRALTTDGRIISNVRPGDYAALVSATGQNVRTPLPALWHAASPIGVSLDGWQGREETKDEEEPAPPPLLPSRRSRFTPLYWEIESSAPVNIDDNNNAWNFATHGMYFIFGYIGHTGDSRFTWQQGGAWVQFQPWLNWTVNGQNVSVEQWQAETETQKGSWLNADCQTLTPPKSINLQVTETLWSGVGWIYTPNFDMWPVDIPVILSLSGFGGIDAFYHPSQDPYISTNWTDGEWYEIPRYVRYLQGTTPPGPPDQRSTVEWGDYGYTLITGEELKGNIVYKTVTFTTKNGNHLTVRLGSDAVVMPTLSEGVVTAAEWNYRAESDGFTTFEVDMENYYDPEDGRYYTLGHWNERRRLRSLPTGVAAGADATILGQVPQVTFRIRR